MNTLKQENNTAYSTLVSTLVSAERSNIQEHLSDLYNSNCKRPIKMTDTDGAPLYIATKDPYCAEMHIVREDNSYSKILSGAIGGEVWEVDIDGVPHIAIEQGNKGTSYLDPHSQTLGTPKAMTLVENIKDSIRNGIF